MPKFISNWLVLGPIYSRFHQTVHSPADGHPVAAEIIADIDDSSFAPLQATGSLPDAPQAGAAISYFSSVFPKSAYTWRPLEFQVVNWENVADCSDNIHQRLGSGEFSGKHHALVFFLVYIDAASDRSARFLVRSDDALRVWLNGAEVQSLSYKGERPVGAAENGAELALRKGCNILLAAVADTHGEWGFSARFEKVEGLTFSTVRPLAPPLVSMGKGVRKTLGAVATEFTVFERNQVLTHDQLNSVTDYLDDQNRLSRVNLLGVGIAQGLRVSCRQAEVKVTRGLGVTTDGDILSFNSDTSFRHFRRYGENHPKYPPFFQRGNVSGSMCPIYELVGQEAATLPGVFPLAEFATVATRDLTGMVALLYMESYVTDSDVCSVASCDNQGQTCRNAQKLLLIDPADAALLTDTQLKHGEEFYASLAEIVAPRILVDSSVTSYTAFIEIFETACANLGTDVAKGLTALGSPCAALFAELFPTDPAASWSDTLSRKGAAVPKRYLQYYYSFLKDLADTCNDLRELLFDATTCCCPAVDAFSKHLLLGVVGETPGSDYRTSFYPSPFLGVSTEHFEHAKFLADKIDTMIESFDLTPPQALIITPSLAEDRPLEERAIPFYYRPDSDIAQKWSYRRARRGGSVASNRFEVRGTGDADVSGNRSHPIGRFTFFRVEGHIGKRVEDMQQWLEKGAQTFALPFSVHAVKVGTGTVDLHRKRPIRYGDLHRIHYLFRQDLHLQVEEMADFSRKIIGTQVEEPSGGATPAAKRVKMLQAKDLSDDSRQALDLEAVKHQPVIAARAEAVKQKVATARYSEYTQAPADLSLELKGAMESAAWLKNSAAENIRAGIVTPIDSFISNTQYRWIDWLDKIIAAKEDQEDQKLLLHNFVRQTHGLEQGCGVGRGGTFLLLYVVDAVTKEKIVVGDFMVPYHLCEAGEDEQEEPLFDLDDLKIRRPDVVTGDGMTLTDPLRRHLEIKVKEEVLTHNANIRGEYMTTFRDYVSIADKTITGFNKSVDAKAEAVSQDITRKVQEAETKVNKIATGDHTVTESDVADTFVSAIRYLSSPLLVDSKKISSILTMTDKVHAAVMDKSARKKLEDAVSELEESPYKTLLKSKLEMK